MRKNQTQKRQTLKTNRTSQSQKQRPKTSKKYKTIKIENTTVLEQVKIQKSKKVGSGPIDLFDVLTLYDLITICP